MNPGKLNKRISILKKEKVSNGGGGFKKNEVPFADCWANINTLSGREFQQAQQMEVEVSHKVTIRFRKDVKRSQLVLFGERRFEIQYIINRDEANRFLELYCIERV